MRRLKENERVVVAMNTRGTIVLQMYDPKRHGPDAKTYGDGDGKDCFTAMMAATKTTNAPIHPYATWKPPVEGLADADRSCELLIGRYNAPKIVLGDPAYQPKGRRASGFTQTF